MNQVRTKKLGFRYFCIFVTSDLTLRPQNMYIYDFRALFDFWKFSVTSCDFWKLGASPLNSTLNFEEIGRDLWALNVLVCCYAANQYSKNISIFF